LDVALVLDREIKQNHTRECGISNGKTDPDEEDAALPRDGHGLGDGGDDGLAAGHQHGAAHRRVHEVLLNENEATNSTKHEAVRNSSKSRIENFSMKRKSPPQTDLHVDDEHGRLAPLGGRRHGPPRFGGAARDPRAGEEALLEVVEEELVEREEQHQQARQQRQM
jgi:hypothetical protein